MKWIMSINKGLLFNHRYCRIDDSVD